MLERNLIDLKNEIEISKKILKLKKEKLAEIKSKLLSITSNVSGEVSNNNSNKNKIEQYMIIVEALAKDICAIGNDIDNKKKEFDNIGKAYNQLSGLKQKVFYQIVFRGLTPKETANRLCYSKSHIYCVAKELEEELNSKHGKKLD